jgi:hypothetical protein
MSIAWWAPWRWKFAVTTLRGKSVGEAYFGENAEDATRCYDRVVATRAPVLDPLPFLERRRGYQGAESLFLPLSNDGLTVNMIMVFFDPEAVVKLPTSP